MDACSTTDVLICGAGAAGLTLALDLARRGVSLRIVEKGQQPFQGSRGKGIQPRTLEVFEDLGIVDRIAAAGGLYPTLREYRDDGSYSDSAVVEDAKPTPAEPYTMPLMVPQFLTERVMRTRLTELGTQVEFGRELVSFEQDETGITARVASNAEPEVIRARYLVGADGGRSFIRQALDIGFPGKTLDIRAVVADLHLTGLTRDAWHRFGEGDMDKQLALCPLLGTDLFQLQAPVPLDGDIDVSVAGLQSMIATRSGRSDIRVQSVSWASAYKMSARLADHYRSGRIFLVGDAAHVHPPTGGQGLNTSVQDAYNLGWKLAAVLSGASDALLDTYEAERRPIAAGILGLSTRLLDAHKRGDMRRGREVRQLDLAYPESALALEEAGKLDLAFERMQLVAPEKSVGYPPARLTASVNARLANTRQRCDLYSTEPCRSACTSTPSAAFWAAASIAAASSFLPVQPASTPFARTALVPAPVTPIDALEQAPLPSSVTAAATPTTANREAGCGNFMYAAPVLAGSTGTRTSTRISSSPTAVVINPLNQSSTFTVRRPLAPSHTISAPSAMIAAG